MAMRLALLLILVSAAPAAQAQVPARPDSLSDSAVALPPITVNVTRGTVPLAQAPQSISVVERSSLGQGRQDLTIEDLLSGIPGLYLSNRYNFSLDQRLSIRGFGSRSNFGLRGVKVLLDGIPQTLPDGQAQLTNVDFGAVQHLEVIRGSASSLYGNASGGVIALESAPPSALPLTQSVKVEGGAFGLFRWQSNTSARRGPLAGRLTMSQFNLDGFRRHSEAEAFQVRAVGEYVLSGHTTASVQLAHASAPRADNPGALTLSEMTTDPRSAAPNNVAREAGKAVSQQQAAMTLRHYGQGLDDITEISLFGVLRDLSNPLATNTFVTLDRRAGGARFSTTRTLLRLPASPEITIGADLQRMRDVRRNAVASGGQATDSILVDQVETVTEAGPFLHLVLRPASHLLLSTGIRFDAVTFNVEDRHQTDGVDNSGSRTMSSWSGNLGVSLVKLPVIVPYANISTSFETPTTTELANQPDGVGGFNDQLTPQRAVNYELGFRGGQTDWLQFSAAIFRARIRDALIQFAEVGGRAFFSNAGRLDNTGVELGLRLAPRAGWELTAAYTYAHYRFQQYRIISGTTTDTLDGNRLAGVPAHFVRLALRISPLRGLRLDLEQQLSSSLFADDANTISVAGWGGGITTMRATWSGHVGGIGLTPFAGVNNVFDRRYVSSVTVNGFGGRVFEPGPGRNAYAGLEVTYPH